MDLKNVYQHVHTFNCHGSALRLRLKCSKQRALQKNFKCTAICLLNRDTMLTYLAGYSLLASVILKRYTVIYYNTVPRNTVMLEYGYFFTSYSNSTQK